MTFLFAVAVAPSNPPHASATGQVADTLRGAVGKRALVREEKSLILGLYSAPEPEVALVPGTHEAYHDAHPRTALLVVEVADRSRTRVGTPSSGAPSAGRRSSLSPSPPFGSLSTSCCPAGRGERG